MVEGARLESVYTFIAYRGFESPSVRQIARKYAPLGALFILNTKSMPKAKMLVPRVLLINAVLQ